MSIQTTFQGGYDFFRKNIVSAAGAFDGADYVGTIEEEL